MSPVLVVMIGTALAAAAPVPPSHPTGRLAGNWAADGIALRTVTTGAIVQGRCSSGKITGAIALDANARFAVQGYFNPQRSGWRLSDIGPRDAPASFHGVVAGDTLELTIRRRGMPDQRHTLVRGAPARFARCTE